MARDKQTMRDVSHTPPMGEPVSDVWARGVGEMLPTEDESTDANVDAADSSEVSAD